MIYKVEFSFEVNDSPLKIGERMEYMFEGGKADVDHMIALAQEQGMSTVITRVYTHTPEVIMRRVNLRLESVCNNFGVTRKAITNKPIL